MVPITFHFSSNSGLNEASSAHTHKSMLQKNACFQWSFKSWGKTSWSLVVYSFIRPMNCTLNALDKSLSQFFLIASMMHPNDKLKTIAQKSIAMAAFPRSNNDCRITKFNLFVGKRRTPQQSVFSLSSCNNIFHPQTPQFYRVVLLNDHFRRWYFTFFLFPLVVILRMKRKIVSWCFWIE